MNAQTMLHSGLLTLSLSAVCSMMAARPVHPRCTAPPKAPKVPLMRPATRTENILILKQKKKGTVIVKKTVSVIPRT